VDDEDDVELDNSGGSFPQSAIILFLHAWQMDSKESGDTSSMKTTSQQRSGRTKQPDMWSLRIAVL
jgi:hypothetical protein